MAISHAEKDKEEDPYPPVGMEVIKVGDANVLVPKGTRIRKEGDLQIVEDIAEFSSRRFVDFEKRFERLEMAQEEIKKELEELRKSVKEIETVTYGEY